VTLVGSQAEDEPGKDEALGSSHGHFNALG
jgi:hypothetical protein